MTITYQTAAYKWLLLYQSSRLQPENGDHETREANNGQVSFFVNHMHILGGRITVFQDKCDSFPMYMWISAEYEKVFCKIVTINNLQGIKSTVSTSLGLGDTIILKTSYF